MKVPTWALAIGGLGLAYLLVPKIGDLRRDAFRVGTQVSGEISDRTGYDVPTPPRSWLPEQNADEQFGVAFRPQVQPGSNDLEMYLGGSATFDESLVGGSGGDSFGVTF